MLLRKIVLILIILFSFTHYTLANDVWLNTNSGVYHCPDSRYFQNTKRGKIIPEKNAISSGYRPAYGKYCNPQSALSGKSEIKQSISNKATNIKVWVNSKSHIYHCPGTKYYGNTKRGTYMTQEEALLSGNRAAYENKCY